jgi:membrane-associated protease RseP (regulator of RpoE activity)
MSFLSILAAIAVLALLIVVHELGHFLAARLQGIHVNRFSIGFGPILWKYQGPETEYALRGIPLGGYVGFPDDDPESNIPANDPNLLRNRPLWDRAIVISAGVIANLVFAYLLLVTQVGILGVPEVTYQPGVMVPQLAAETSGAAIKAGLKAGDIILAVNGKTLDASEKAMFSLMETIQDSPGEPIQLQVQRSPSQLELTVTPELGADGKSRIGVQLSPNLTVVRHPSLNPVEIAATAAKEFQRIVILTVQGFGQVLSHFNQAASQVSGPVAIVAMGADIARSDAVRLLQFAALISVNLAVINILPLPALDGGQLAFLLVEGLLGRPLPSRFQDGVMQTGLVLLLGLGVVLIVRDTLNLASVAWVQRLFQ